MIGRRTLLLAGGAATFFLAGLPHAPAARERSSNSASGEHYVEPHTTKKGRKVRGHYQTNPDGTTRDNYSTKGNVNPHTGKRGTRKPKD